MRKAGGVVDFRWGGQEGPRDAEVRAGARGGGEAGGGGVARAQCGRVPKSAAVGLILIRKGR